MKIAVLGFSGSGKSTLARTLAEGLGCPVLHLDRIQFVSGWKLRDRGEAAVLAEEFLDAHDSWVIDGNYKTFSQERRLREADSILFLNFSRWSCLLRVIRRSLRYRGGTRPDMADGCTEKLDWEFVRWVLWEGRSPAMLRRILENWPDKTVILKNQRQLDRYVEEMSC